MQHTKSLHDIMIALELDPKLFPIRINMPAEEAMKKLEEFQIMIRNHRKKLAKKYHPDKLRDQSNNRMKEINNLVDILLNLKIQVQRRPRIVMYKVYPGFTGYTSIFTNGTFCATS